MDGSKSCTFLALKYLLIVVLIVELINLVIAIPTALNEEVSEGDGRNSKRTIFLLTRGSNIVVSIIALVAVARELFCLSLAVAILMLIETVLPLLIERSGAAILAAAFNASITMIVVVFALLLRSVNKERARVASAEQTVPVQK